jgi:ABC-type nitrate/sulfonate/bicarbonate transport system, permease component
MKKFSITRYNSLPSKNTNKKSATVLPKVLAVLFWLAVWHVVSGMLNSPILLPSPITVFETLALLVQSEPFWHTVLFSLIRVAVGFFAGAVTGLFCAVLAYNFKAVRTLLEPLFTVATAIPVASFIILALVWLNARSLSVFTSFIMVFPVVYMNCLKGLQATSVQLLEMASVFNVHLQDKVRYIYLPSLMPFFLSACKTALGLAWKSGIAAEIIGLPSGSIGERLYLSKLYLNMPEMFSFTIAVILLSICFEWVFLAIISFIEVKNKGGAPLENNPAKPE